MDIEFYPVILIYNSDIESSVSYNNLSKIGKMCITILDNSDDENVKKNNLERSQLLDIKYIPMNGNVGLSKAYNRFLDSFKEKTENKIIIWLDDDTAISEEYFFELKEILKKKVDIMAPIILGQDGRIWSPNSDRYIKNKQLRNVNDKVDLNRFNAINSCTAVRSTVYKDYRYDERLFLDQVDHLFFYEQRKLNRNFFQMGTIIKHNFAMKERNQNFNSVKRRYSIMIPDFIMYGRIRKYNPILIYLKILGWAVREMINTRELKTFFWILRKAVNTVSKEDYSAKKLS
ncbi:glycosyltransferase [Enterococcus innesii]|uniref:glycosyltransferase n=1 Tax=Enterococcus TaxID=1350 RepID=UPI0034A25697